MAVSPLASVHNAVILPVKSAAALAATGSRSGISYARTESPLRPPAGVLKTCQPAPHDGFTAAKALPHSNLAVRLLMPSIMWICPSVVAKSHKVYLPRGNAAAV